MAFRARGVVKSRETIPAPLRGLTLDSDALPHLLSPETWKRNPRHADARAARLIGLARTTRSFVVRGPLHAGGTALACATLGSILADYETAERGSAAADLGNMAAYLSAGAVVRARAGFHDVDPPEVDLFLHAGFLVLAGLGTEARADRISDLLDERLRSEMPIAVVTTLTASEAKHRYGDVGEALFGLPVLDLTPSMTSVPSEYAWARFDDPELPRRVGPEEGTRRPRGEALVRAAREAVDQIEERRVVVLVGPSMAGKTSLAVAMGTELVERDPSRSFLFVDAYELQDADKPRFGAAQFESSLVADAKSVDVLVLDELGAERIPKDRASVAAEILHHRHKHELITLITTPKRSKQLRGLYGDGIYRRFADRARTSYLVLGELQQEREEQPV